MGRGRRSGVSLPGSIHVTCTTPAKDGGWARTWRATVRTAVEERRVLQEYQRDFFRTALEEADADPVDGWIFGDPVDGTLNRAFPDLLLDHRIEVYGLAEPRTVDGLDFAPGSAWVVPAAQPQYRLARSIFERTEEFADSVFYDASTWTISLAYGIPDGELRGGRLSLGPRVTAVPPAPADGSVYRGGVAYLIDWRDLAAPRALRMLQAAGLRAEAAFQPFTARTAAGGDVDFGRGSISIPVAIQGVPADSVRAVMEAVERVTGLSVHAATTGYSAMASTWGAAPSGRCGSRGSSCPSERASRPTRPVSCGTSWTSGSPSR